MSLPVVGACPVFVLFSVCLGETWYRSGADQIRLEDSKPQFARLGGNATVEHSRAINSKLHFLRAQNAWATPQGEPLTSNGAFPGSLPTIVRWYHRATKQHIIAYIALME